MMLMVKKTTDLMKLKCLETPLLVICARVWLGCRDYEPSFGLSRSVGFV